MSERRPLMNATSVAKQSKPRSPSTDSPRAVMRSSTETRSTADLLKELRRSFPDMPLAERIAALETLRRTHIPR
jgi:hypothetical protein